jgi:hypothetical protein
MDELESDAGPNTPGKVEVNRRTVIEADTTALLLTTLPRAALAAGPVDDGKRATIRRRSIVVAAIAVAATALIIIGVGASRSVAAEPEAASLPHATEYLPSISDLMIATIQPRHERLWRAEQDENWEFAAYELGNLRGAFSRLGNAHPIEHDIAFPEMIASVTERPFKELNSAIQSKDHTAFAKAYADLTDACNSCHQALNHGVVEIRIPNRTSASDLH